MLFRNLGWFEKESGTCIILNQRKARTCASNNIIPFMKLKNSDKLELVEK